MVFFLGRFGRVVVLLDMAGKALTALDPTISELPDSVTFCSPLAKPSVPVAFWDGIAIDTGQIVARRSVVIHGFLSGNQKQLALTVVSRHIFF